MLARIISVFVVALLLSFGLANAGTVTPIFSFDDMTVNANSDSMPQSSTAWNYVPNTEYGADSLDQWLSAKTGMAFKRYVVWENNSHMGYPYYGFLEIDNQVSVKGNALKCTITGGNNVANLSGAGLKVSNKSQYVAQRNSSYKNAVVGDPYLYFLANNNWSPNAPPQQTFPSVPSNANRLTMYVKAPAGVSVDFGYGRPFETWSIGPFSNKAPNGGASTGGHFYHDIPVGGGGWSKLQLDNHPRYHNSGGTIHANIPGYIPSITGLYITGANYEGQVMTPYSIWIDEMQFEYDDYAQQNNETINSLSVGYNDLANTWEVGFHDKYQDHVYFAKAKATYEIRYSFSPITNENWASATPANIQAYPNFGIEARADGRFKRVTNDDYQMVWSRFKLASAADDASFATNRHIYFAVKDVSQDPNNMRNINPGLTGTLVGQGRDYAGASNVFDDYATDAVSLPYIKRIDFALPGASAPTVDITAPTVSIASPSNSSTVTGTGSVTANASDNVAVTKVEFYVNSILQATDTATPYLYSWNTSALPAGGYILMVKAYDAAGNVGQSANVSVTVANDTTPPTVSLTSPANNASLSGIVNITATASDNMGVSRVEFYHNSTMMYVSNVSPFSYAWTSTAAANGSCALTARAYDAAGNVGLSPSVTVTVNNVVADTTAPTVAISSPVNNASVSGAAAISVSASDNVGVSKVEFYVNAVLQATDAASPYTFSWNTATLANGSYVLTARAYDAAGNVGLSPSVTVTVNNVVADTTAPGVAISSPANNSSVSGAVTISASASDNVGVSKVELYVNAVLQATDTTSPYTFNWNTATLANGSYALTAKAYDAAGNVGLSSSVTVTVNNVVADTTAPTVAISSPANNASVSGAAVISVSASDNVGVSKVELYVNAVLQATDTASPYTFSWNTATLANGSYALTAKAYDAAGNVVQSSSVTVSVNNVVQASFSIWPATAKPVVVADPDSSAIEVGMKFRSDIKGTITGIRFYKASTNTGTHVANLWTTAGKLLASATFKNETASGWQQVSFTTPVAITANTVYVASYHTNVGHYSDDQNYFAGKGVDNGSLHALADGVSGYSGVYSYGSTSKFPKSGWNSSNYWVDVVFKP